MFVIALPYSRWDTPSQGPGTPPMTFFEDYSKSVGPRDLVPPVWVRGTWYPQCGSEAVQIFLLFWITHAPRFSLLAYCRMPYFTYTRLNIYLVLLSVLRFQLFITLRKPWTKETRLHYFCEEICTEALKRIYTFSVFNE